MKMSAIEAAGYSFQIDRIAVDKAADSIFILQTDLVLSADQIGEIRKRWNEQWQLWGMETPRTLILTSGLSLRDLTDLELELYGLRRDR